MPTLVWRLRPKSSAGRGISARGVAAAGSDPVVSAAAAAAAVPDSISAIPDPAGSSGVALSAASAERYADGRKKKKRKLNRAEPAKTARKTSKAKSERDLPQGVTLSRRRFVARTHFGGKDRYVGAFDTPEQASAAYLSVKKDLHDARLLRLGADEVNAILDAAKKKAVEVMGGYVPEKRDLPPGVYKTLSGTFAARIRWGGTVRYIGTFDTPEQASAAYQSVKKDLAGAKPSKLGGNEVLALFDAMVFDAAQKKAIEAVGGANPRKRKPKASPQESAGGSSMRELPRGVRKTRNGKFETKTRWNGKDRYIGTFDTSEQASAAYVSVKKDLAEFKPSMLSTDEADTIFDAAQKKAVEAVGGPLPRKKKSKVHVSSNISPGTDVTAPPRPKLPPPSKDTDASLTLLAASPMQHTKATSAAIYSAMTPYM